MVSKMKMERIRQGFTLETLQKATGVDMTRLWMVENGLVPKPEHIVAICTTLGVSPQEMFPVFEARDWFQYLIGINPDYRPF